MTKTKKENGKKPLIRLPAVRVLDPRKKLLAQMAGNIAAGIMSAPNDAPSTTDKIAAMSVEIAEEILTKVGIHPSGTS